MTTSPTDFPAFNNQNGSHNHADDDNHGHGHRIDLNISAPPTADRVHLVEETFGKQPYVTIREYYDADTNTVVHQVNAGGGINGDPQAVANLLSFVAGVLQNNEPDNGAAEQIVGSHDDNPGVITI